ncbi:helix-turn-helix domain-containing protein [Mycobacterium sp. AMU20-3851]|uniref:sigma-54-dependent Fis family transcriptional regulator n=1 Tax=Mycobacterium sp. AMU20-3851 TaxID=3122055 RepID=UPI003754EEE9
MADGDDLQALGIAPAVLQSWRRSLQYGLSAQSLHPLAIGVVDNDSPLVRAAHSVISHRELMLKQSMCGLSLTDNNGVVLRQWVRDPSLDRWLGDHGLVPSASVDETTIGTTSGICLLNERPTMICGPEHFFDGYAAVTSAGVPVVHPVTRRTVGSLNLTSRVRDTSPVLLSWLMELVRDIEGVLQASATQRERALLDAYLSENRDTRHPLVALNDHTIITNATAARLLSSVDQALLWEHASRAIGERIQDPREVILTNGTLVSIHCREILGATESAGAVVRIRHVPESRIRALQAPQPVSLPGLVGEGLQWRELCRAAAAADRQERVLLVGERGTGKTAVARAMAGENAMVLDACEVAVTGTAAWLQRLAHTLQSDAVSAVIIRRCDELDPATADSVTNALLTQRNRAIRVLATTRDSVEHSHSTSLGTAFALVLSVPPLRERYEDLPVLLDALTRKACRRLGRTTGEVRWMPDAVQALSRLQWQGNITSLDTVVNRVLQSTSNQYINTADLPADVVASASRRKLAGLEHVEANAITAALRATGGNKNRAAENLGIARSTLDRKIRSLGIDLTTAAF